MNKLSSSNLYECIEGLMFIVFCNPFLFFFETKIGLYYIPSFIIVTGIIILFYIPLLNLGSVGTGIMSTELLSFHPIYGGLHVVGPQQICLE